MSNDGDPRLNPYQRFLAVLYNKYIFIILWSGVHVFVILVLF